MKRLKIFALFLVLISVFLSAPLQTVAEEEAKDTNQENIAAFQKMLDFVGDTKKLSVTVESSYDALQNSGQLLEFGAVSTWHIKRPDKVRVDVVLRDGNQRHFYFDGSTITLYDKDQNVYAVVEKKGNIDQAFDYFIDDLGMPLPLAELFSEDHPFSLKEDIKSSTYLGDSTISGAVCNEYAFRSEEIDLQLWIEQGENPLPKRFVITYTDSDGQPQYRAQFTGWNLEAEVPDSLFEFTPPKDAEKIRFSKEIVKQ